MKELLATCKMIGVMLCWVVIGTSATKDISTAHSWVSAPVHQAALLPLCFHPQSTLFNFISIKWEFITINRHIPILVYMLHKCKQDGISRHWWEKECKVTKEIDEAYQQRAGILENGTLRIFPARIKDSGLYQATVLIFGGKHTAIVNLTVTEVPLSFHPSQSNVVDMQEKDNTKNKVLPSPYPLQSTVMDTQEKDSIKGKGFGALRRMATENMIRMGLACLTLFFLGLLLVEHVCNLPGGSSNTRKKDCGRP
nr:PREDICTED: uncharacterized protein LOC100562845 [Anolis carolinensis]|eukprot:XP_008118302.1 PREDICTED: uncharacterized protein LOC100562845 [Anolis carolinensis]